MEVVALLLFIGALWVFAAIALFAWNLLNANADHADRLALLPLEDNWVDSLAPHDHSSPKPTSKS
ncbi:MAG: hypothetical protein QM778_16660 [Myxococcales bacterium]